MKQCAISLLLLFGAINASQLYGQPCKPAVRANRGIRFRLLSNEVTAYSWTDPKDPSLQLELRKHVGHSDSVTVNRNGRKVAALATDGFQILGARYTAFDEKGRISRIDTLQPGKATNSTYFGLLKAHTSVVRLYYESGLPAKVIRKSDNGADSLTETWSVHGTLLTRTTDSCEQKWTQQGTLGEERQLQWPHLERTFYDDGILKTVSFDTLVYNDYRVHCVRDYYTTGILQKVSFFYLGAPCLKWREYNSSGVLQRETSHPSPDQYPFVEMGVERSPEILYVVERTSGYRLGKDAWIAELRTLLANQLCDSKKPLSGEYTISYRISGQSVELVDVTGRNAEALRAGLQEFMERKAGMWQSANWNGILLSEVQTLRVSIVKAENKK